MAHGQRIGGADAAVQLHCLMRDLAPGVEAVGGCAIERTTAARIGFASGAHAGTLRSVDHGRHFLFEHVELGHAVLQGLVGADRPAELAPHFQIGKRVAIKRTHGAVGFGAQGKAGVIEPPVRCR